MEKNMIILKYFDATLKIKFYITVINNTFFLLFFLVFWGISNSVGDDDFLLIFSSLMQPNRCKLGILVSSKAVGFIPGMGCCRCSSLMRSHPTFMKKFSLKLAFFGQMVTSKSQRKRLCLTYSLWKRAKSASPYTYFKCRLTNK